ncbi:hypothetical protein JX266_014491, partial [Neoarthrinium moseri]
FCLAEKLPDRVLNGVAFEISQRRLAADGVEHRPDVVQLSGGWEIELRAEGAPVPKSAPPLLALVVVLTYSVTLAPNYLVPLDCPSTPPWIEDERERNAEMSLARLATSDTPHPQPQPQPQSFGLHQVYPDAGEDDGDKDVE